MQGSMFAKMAYFVISVLSKGEATGVELTVSGFGIVGYGSGGSFGTPLPVIGLPRAIDE